MTALAMARRPRPALLSAAPWVTFAIVLIGFMAAAYSIQSANWVQEMPSLVLSVFVGLVSGWLLAHVRAPEWALHLVALVTGVVVTVGEAMQTMVLADPLNSGISGRWLELRERLADWADALVHGDLSNDRLPFVLLVVLGTWLMGYIASWAVFRWRNAWLALLPAGFALLTNISYLRGHPSGEFIVFLFAGMLLVTRLHYLRSLADWEQQRVPRPAYLWLEVFTFAAWVGLVLIVVAWLVPTANNWGPLADRWAQALSPLSDRLDRVGRVFVGVRSKQAAPVHSFGDTLPLRGAVNLGDPAVLYTVVAPQPLYLRGAVYDVYTSAGWRASSASARAVPAASTSGAAAAAAAQAAQQQRRTVQVEITVDSSIAAKRLLTPGEPLAASVDAKLLVGAAPDDVVGLVPNGRVRDGDRYSAAGTVSAASDQALLVSGRDYPQWVSDRYLQLPVDLPTEVRALARRIAGRSSSPYLQARLVESYLRANYPVDLAVAQPPPRRDAVAYFLFDAQRGYFDYHASAMAVLLRTLGIPARIVAGFALSPADFDEQAKAYAVTERRSWAWPEAYFAGLGWVEFNPTSAEPLVERLAAGPLGNQGVDDVPIPGVDTLGSEGLLPDALPPSPVASSNGQPALRGPVLVAVKALLGAAAAIVALWVLLAGAWTLRFRGLPPARARWAKVQQLAAWAGIALPPYLTTMESASAMATALGGEAALALDTLARAYSRDRYGGAGRALAAEEVQRLDDAYVSARNRLLGGIARRPLGWLPRRSARRQDAAA